MKVFAALLLFASCIAVAYCTLGVDVSTAVPQSDWTCLKNAGYAFAVVRCYRSSGSVDPNCASNVKYAKAAGIKNVDVYLFPCFSCGNPAGQVSATVSYLKNNSVPYGELWLDVEGTWGSTSASQSFFSGLVSETKVLGVTTGVYTSQSQWTAIMGSSYKGGDAYPLWYAHYDNSPSFSDFVAFGGWTKPAIKQYEGDATVCGVGVDINYY